MTVKMKNLIKATVFALLCLVAICVMTSCEEEHIHNFGDWTVVKTPTCTENGEQERWCSCGEKQTQTVVATGHSFGEWKSVKVVSCTEDGLQERECQCGEKQTQTIEGGHRWVDATCTEPQKCTYCSATVGEALGHTSTTGKCSRCGQEIYPEVHLPSSLGTFNYMYGKTINSSVDITSLTYEFDKYGDLVFYFSGEKTYDYEGASGTTSIYVYVKVLDEEGYTVAAEDYRIIWDLHVGDKFKDREWKIGVKTLQKYPSTYYTVVLEDSR